MAKLPVPGSFRDPSGFLFVSDGILYRQINPVYLEHYGLLRQSGLYDALVSRGSLIPHQEVAKGKSNSQGRVIRPEPVPFISYPYEWCFSQLKDAALLTLEIQRTALDHGMSLKDCSAYNVQFRNGKPVLIDTLSFERYREGEPWVAYRQFCQHFLAPLALMSLKDVRLNQLLRVYIDGIPIDLASSLLPYSSRFKFRLLAHIHLQARLQRKYADKPVSPGKRRVSQLALRGLIDNLDGAVRGLNWRPRGTEWSEYYDITNYSDSAFAAKKKIVTDYLRAEAPRTVWDLGANTGVFSRLASAKSAFTVAFDLDPAAVEKNYQDCKASGEASLLPLLMDLTNPSGGIGWDHEERTALRERGPADTVLALALIHHLAISNNVPFDKIATFFGRLCRTLIIEFVPKEDSQVQRLLASREDVFADYDQASFESVFSRQFKIQQNKALPQSSRILYLMKNKRTL